MIESADNMVTVGALDTPQVEKLPGHLIRRAQQQHYQRWMERLGGDLTGPQYAIISVVHEHPGIDQQAAAELASLDRSTGADVISRLARNGWLRRDRDATDGRRAVLTLTAPSRTALGRVTAIVGEVQDLLLAALGAAERHDLIRLLGQVAYRGNPPTSPPHTLAPAVLALSTAPGHLLRRAEQVHQSLWSEYVPAPTTPSQFTILCVLAPGPLDRRSVGARASLDPSSTADILARMRKRDLVVMEHDPADGRRRRAALTQRGYALLEQLTPSCERVQQGLVAPLSDRDTSRLLTILAKIIDKP